MPNDIFIQHSLFLSHIHALYNARLTDEIVLEMFKSIMIITTCIIVTVVLNPQYSWGFKTDPTYHIPIIMITIIISTFLVITFHIDALTLDLIYMKTKCFK